MEKKSKAPIPDAWDDDWETAADKTSNDDQDGGQDADGGAPLSKKERLQQHREANRRIWEQAETQKQAFHFVEASSAVPLATNYQPQVKVLSRKPMIVKRPAGGNGTAGMSIQDDEDEEDAEDKKPKETPEERAARNKSELEEKKRKYEEARRRLFGDEDESQHSSSPAGGSGARGSGERGRGRGRGGRGGGGNSRGGGQGGDVRRTTASGGDDERKLYDPNYAPKPRPGTPQKRQGREDEPMQAVREPRGPDSRGRGFGARRGGGA